MSKNKAFLTNFLKCLFEIFHTLFFFLLNEGGSTISEFISDKQSLKRPKINPFWNKKLDFDFENF